VRKIQNLQLGLLELLKGLILILEIVVVVCFVSMANYLQMLSGFWEGSR
jgi:hypothetical protein